MSRSLRIERGLARVLGPLYRRLAGGERRPVFHDVRRTLPELRRIDENYDAIRRELLGVLPAVSGMRRYHEVDPRQRAISAAGEGSWRVFFPLRNRDRCPRTSEIVEGIPGVLQAFFSILEPGKSVPSHEGPGSYYLRYPTAFLVPEQDPPTLRVKDRHDTWKEGESVLFDDSWDHEVVNRSRDTRIVLITDVRRPLPWLLRPTAELWHWARRRADASIVAQ